MLVGPVLLMLRSATGVMVVVTGGIVLLVGLGSPVGDPAVAMLVRVPLAGAFNVKNRFVV
jgi:hypothetical protein